MIEENRAVMADRLGDGTPGNMISRVEAIDGEGNVLVILYPDPMYSEFSILDRVKW